MLARILVVDDSPEMRVAIRTVLAAQPGVEICGEAIDGVDGIEKAELLKPDLILMDLTMPRLNGVEAAGVLKSRVPGAHVVLFTMYETFMGKSLAEVIGLSAVISKADGVSRLRSCIQSLLPPDRVVASGGNTGSA